MYFMPYPSPFLLYFMFRFASFLIRSIGFLLDSHSHTAKGESFYMYNTHVPILTNRNGIKNLNMCGGRTLRCIAYTPTTQDQGSRSPKKTEDTPKQEAIQTAPG